MRDIINHPEYPWDWKNISENPGLTMQMIVRFPKKMWCWSAISCNPGITIQDIKENPNYHWHMKYIFGNDFQIDQQMYVNNQIGRLLLVSMYEDDLILFNTSNNEHHVHNVTNNMTNLINMDHSIGSDTFNNVNANYLVLVFWNHYHLRYILDYV